MVRCNEFTSAHAVCAHWQNDSKARPIPGTPTEQQPRGHPQATLNAQVQSQEVIIVEWSSITIASLSPLLRGGFHSLVGALSSTGSHPKRTSPATRAVPCAVADSHKRSQRHMIHRNGKKIKSRSRLKRRRNCGRIFIHAGSVREAPYGNTLSFAIAVARSRRRWDVAPSCKRRTPGAAVGHTGRISGLAASTLQSRGWAGDPVTITASRGPLQTV